MLTRDQQYSIDAYEKITTIKKAKAEADIKAYGSMSHKLPILIRTAGLSQALAFVEAHGKEIQRALLEDLAQTIGQKNRETFLRNARQAPLKEYMFLTRQSLDALLWYKRFAQSVLHVDASDMADNEGE
jgi:CRISPR-associated protein Cmr5